MTAKGLSHSFSTSPKPLPTKPFAVIDVERIGEADANIAGMAPFDIARDRNDEFMLGVLIGNVFQLRFELCHPFSVPMVPSGFTVLVRWVNVSPIENDRSYVIVFCIVES